MFQPSGDCEGCQVISKVRNLLELYSDARISYQEFIDQVIGDLRNVSISEVHQVIENIQNERKPLQFQPSISCSGASNEFISFEMKEIYGGDQPIGANSSGEIESRGNEAPVGSTSDSNTFKEYVLDKSSHQS